MFVCKQTLKICASFRSIGTVGASKSASTASFSKEFLHDELTQANARKAFTILNLAFKAAMRGRLGPDRRIPGNPCELQELAPVNATARGVPWVEEVTKILFAAEEIGRTWDIFCRLTATLGTRRGETCALRTDDFDLRRRLIHVDETAVIAPEGGLALKPPKSWQSRMLHVPHDGFWQQIEAFLEGRRPRDFLFSGWVRDPVLRNVQTGPKCWHPSSASHKFASMMKQVGLIARDTARPYTLHALRHFVATVLYNQSHDWVQVAKFLGHNDPSITIRLYSNHVVEESQRALGELAAAPWWGEGDALEGAGIGDQGSECMLGALAVTAPGRPLHRDLRVGHSILHECPTLRSAAQRRRAT